MLFHSLVFLIFFGSCYLHDSGADLHQIFQEDSKWVAIVKLRFLVFDIFREVDGRLKKVTFASDPPAQYARWRQNGFTYSKKKPAWSWRI